MAELNEVKINEMETERIEKLRFELISEENKYSELRMRIEYVERCSERFHQLESEQNELEERIEKLKNEIPDFSEETYEKYKALIRANDQVKGINKQISKIVQFKNYSKNDSLKLMADESKKRLEELYRELDNLNKSDIYRKKIVIVDDNKDITDAISTLLEFENFSNIYTFNKPRKALDFLKQNEPDLIIADLSLPGMNGLDFFEEVKKQHSNVRKILIGAYMSEKNLIRAINETKIDKYIEKPWDNDALIDCIKSELEK